MKHPRLSFLALAGAALTTIVTAGAANAREFVLGMQCDRSGPTQVVGNYICDGAHDYIRLANKMGMFGEGNSVRNFEIDHGYNVPRGVEAYERSKEAGHVSYGLYGTPHTYALTPKLTSDKTPGTSPDSAARGPRTARATRTSSRWPRPTGRRPGRPSSSSWTNGRRPASPGSPRSPISTTTTRPDASRSRCCGTSRAVSASRCASTRSRLPGWTCARRCSTSCAATRRTGSSTTPSARPPRYPSRS